MCIEYKKVTLLIEHCYVDTGINIYGNIDT